MKFTTASLLAVAASGTVAQNWNQSAPFQLKLANSNNATLNGQKLYACHAGAIEQGLCLSETLQNPNSPSLTFYQNTTSDYGPNYGPLVWNQPISFGDVDHLSEPMTLDYQPNSNVAVAMIRSGTGETWVRFTDAGKMVLSVTFDDSTFQFNQWPNPVNAQLSQWYACWAQVGGYWYHALTWVTGGTPHNPTCDAVDVYKVDL